MNTLFKGPKIIILKFKLSILRKVEKEINLVKALTSNVLRELPTEILVKRNAWSKGEKRLGIFK